MQDLYMPVCVCRSQIVLQNLVEDENQSVKFELGQDDIKQWTMREDLLSPTEYYRVLSALVQNQGESKSQRRMRFENIPSSPHRNVRWHHQGEGRLLSHFSNPLHYLPLGFCTHLLSEGPAKRCVILRKL